MATTLTPETLTEIQYIARHNAHLFPKEANALLDHITALEEELKVKSDLLIKPWLKCAIKTLSTTKLGKS